MPHRKWQGDEGEIQPVIILKENAQGEFEPLTNPASGSAGGGGGSGVDPVSIKDGTDPSRKLAVDTDGRIGVNNWPGTQPVSGSVSVSNFPATQPVSGTVSVSNPTANPETGLAKEATLESLRADIANGISAAITNFPATQPVSGTITVGNSSLAVTGPLTDAQLRAAAVPVSGTFWQATQPISGTVAVSGEVDITPASPAAGTYLPVRLTDGSAFYVASGGGAAAIPATFSAETPYVATAAAAATKVIFAMMNPIGSGKLFKIRTIWVSAGNAAPPAALGMCEWLAKRITAIVGGTQIAAIKMDTADGVTAATTTNLVHSPTSVTAALTTSAWTSRWVTAIGTANVLGYLPGQFIRFGDFGHKPLTLRPGEGISIEEFTRVIHAPNVVAGIEWTEE